MSNITRFCLLKKYHYFIWKRHVKCIQVTTNMPRNAGFLKRKDGGTLYNLKRKKGKKHNLFCLVIIETMCY
mgnify:CR=1 FL=1